MKKFSGQTYSSRELLSDLRDYIRPYRKKFWSGTFARASSDIVWLFPPWAISEIITFAANYQAGDSPAYVWKLLAAMLAVAFYHYLMHEFAKYKIYQIAENANIDAHKKVLRHLFKVDLQWHEKENSGNKIQKITKGGSSLNKIIRLYVNLFIESAINLVAILVILATFDLNFALILLFFFVSYYLLSFYLTKAPVRQSHLVNLEQEKFSGLAFESINNISTVKSLRLGERIVPYIIALSAQLYGLIRKRIYLFRLRAGILNIYQEFFRILVISFTLYQVFAGNLEVGVVALVMLYFGKIEEAASEFAATYSEFVTAKIDMLRMKEILRTKPLIEEMGTLSYDSNWQKLRLQDVSFSYKGQNILQDLSLTISRGQNIGIVGISGSGKSTLFKLLLKLYNNYQGEVLFDSNSLRDLRRPEYLTKIAVVPQETELFNLSLRENITFNTETEDSEALKRALEIAHVDEFLHKLPNGIESLVGEKGIKLSGGEKQRVGIARAIYRRPEILLLDEATSHLDVESEQKIQAALHEFFKETTAIVIAHRLSTIMEMDQILVMGEGKVLESGTVQELIANKAHFYELWQRQNLRV